MNIRAAKKKTIKYVQSAWVTAAVPNLMGLHYSLWAY